MIFKAKQPNQPKQVNNKKVCQCKKKGITVETKQEFARKHKVFWDVQRHQVQVERSCSFKYNQNWQRIHATNWKSCQPSLKMQCTIFCVSQNYCITWLPAGTKSIICQFLIVTVRRQNSNFKNIVLESTNPEICLYSVPRSLLDKLRLTLPGFAS